MDKVTLQTNIGELIENYPQVVEVLIDYGIPCASCHFSSYDSLGDSIAEFRLEEEDTADLLAELNEIVALNDQE
jgi:hybrid cluster-associated redox disulfide protein